MVDYTVTASSENASLTMIYLATILVDCTFKLTSIENLVVSAPLTPILRLDPFIPKIRLNKKAITIAKNNIFKYLCSIASLYIGRIYTDIEPST